MANPLRSRARTFEWIGAAVALAIAVWRIYVHVFPAAETKTPSSVWLLLASYVTPVIALVLAALLLVGLTRDHVVRMARPIEVLLGLIFLLGAYLKAIAANAFLKQIFVYKVFTDINSLAAVALTVLALETFLASALLLGLRLRLLVLLGVQALLLFFTGLILYAWQVHGLANCGCMGELVVTPPEAITKNVILMLLAGIAIRGFLNEVRMPPSGRGEAVKAAIAAVAALAVLVYSWPQIFQSGVTELPQKAASAEPASELSPAAPVSSPTSPPLPSRPLSPLAKYVIESDTGEQFDLSRGDYLVAMLSMTCDHCKASVPHLNALMHAPAMPPLVALAEEARPGDMAQFVAETQPMFPIRSLGSNFLEFAPLLGDASAPPRLVLLRDGVEAADWHGEELPFAEIEERVRSLRAGTQ